MSKPPATLAGRVRALANGERFYPVKVRAVIDSLRVGIDEITEALDVVDVTNEAVEDHRDDSSVSDDEKAEARDAAREDLRALADVLAAFALLAGGSR